MQPSWHSRRFIPGRTDEERVADALLTGVEHLRADRFADALESLELVVDALRDQRELQDVFGRACGLMAQAALGCNAPARARTACHDAMRVARAIDDLDGLTTLRTLDEQIGAELDRQKRLLAARARAVPLAARTTESLEAEGSSALATADALLKHVNALRLVGEVERALHSAKRAVVHADRAGTVRERVLARLAVFESNPVRTGSLHEAHEIADGNDETTLLGLVAKAAELADVELARQYGPLNVEDR